MALVLTYPELTAAMESQSRRPLISIVSSQSTLDIPFDGQFLTSQTRNESKPNTIMLLSGRWCQIFMFNVAFPGVDIFRYVYTDTNRTTFSFVDIPANGIPDEACLCETAAGNVLVVYRDVSGGNERLRRLVISPIGEVITGGADALIGSFATAVFVIQGPFVIRLANGTYLMVYSKKTVSGATYVFMKRTSADGLTWSAESALSISGLTNTKPIYNPSLLQITTGDVYLSFEYREAISGTQERYNIYQSISADNGVTWGTAVARTTYPDYTAVARHPIMVQKQANQMHLAYTEQCRALNMTHDTPGSCTTASFQPGQITVDPVTRKAYVTGVDRHAGNRPLRAVFKVDIDTWTINDCWNCGTVPAFQASLCIGNDSTVWHDCDHGERFYIPVSDSGSDVPSVSVLNAEADTIKQYIFKTGIVEGVTLTKNVDVSLSGLGTFPNVVGSWIDYNSLRLYVLIANTYLYTHAMTLGWISLTQVISGEELYTWNQIFFDTGWTEQEMGATEQEIYFTIHPTNDYVIVSGGAGVIWPGRTKVYNLSTGGVYKDYKVGLFPSFPYYGLNRHNLVSGKIVGSFSYYAGQVDYRGLCMIDLATNNITYSPPTWAAVDDFKLLNITVSNDGVLFITTNGYGITSYDPSTGIWTEPFTNTTLPGLMIGNTHETYGAIAPDDASGLIFVGGDDLAEGFSAFSRYGSIKQSHYRIGTYASGWIFTAPAPLVQGFLDYDLVMALDPNDKGVYALWTNQAIQELSLKWDKENSAMDLSPYIVRGQPITDDRDVGKPNNLTFTLSHGNFFDPHNSRSLWSAYVKPGRKLVLRYGERVGATEYWIDGGTFEIVPASDVGYERAAYPNIQIEAQDFRHAWNVGNDNSTDAYTTTPKEIIEDVLQDLAGLELTDMSIPAFDGSVVIYPQWVKTTIQQIIDDIANRFCYFPMVTNVDKFTMRKITRNNPIDHAYADLTKIKNFSFSNKGGDMVTRVRIEGESHDFIELLFSEERISSLSGTIGWWGGTKKYTVWYSDDKTRRCRFPRLKVIASTKSIGFQLAGGVNEGITVVDPNDFYCIVKIEVSNLAPALVAAIGLWVSAYFNLLIFCQPFSNTCFDGNVQKMVAIFLALMILASVVNFQYEIWAQSVGKERQSFSAESYADTDLEGILGKSVLFAAKDPLCHTYDQCKFVADNGIMLKMLQRNGATWEMMTDLRREIGDTVTIPHPESGEAMTFFIHHLRRVTVIPEGRMEGLSQADNIEAWRVD